jgi:integrase
LIFQISGQRKKVFTENKLHPVNWEIDKQLASFIALKEAKKSPLVSGINDLDAVLLLNSEVTELNHKLTNIRQQIADIEKRFQLDKFVYSVDDVIQRYKENTLDKTQRIVTKLSLLDFFDTYINDHLAVRSAGTLITYKALQVDIKNYELANKEKVYFETIGYSFFQKFQSYLINKGDINNLTIGKKLSSLKTVLEYARKCGVKIDQGYRDFTIRRQKLEVIALSQDEFDRLLNKDFSKNKKLEKVRDIFCFSCTTGLRISDLMQLKREHIKSDEINITVKKTGSELTIPLNKISSQIISKYKDLASPLPKISNQKLNEYIKEACRLADITEAIEIVRFRGKIRESNILPKYKLIHIHTGRKTFVTLSLEKGMSAEEVMAITGHTDYKSFKRYVDVTKKRSKVVMVKAWGEVPKLFAV